jgi:low affinity Fe/Cu permease
VASEPDPLKEPCVWLRWHGLSTRRCVNLFGNSCREKPRREGGAFQKLARASSRAAGNPVAFGIAVSVLFLWAILGPVFGFSDTWQLIINTATTIVTFLMVFLIQNTQNRDSEAMQLKLDELLRCTKGAHNALLDIEELSPRELDQMKGDYADLARKARENLRRGGSDIDCPDIENNGNGHAKNGQRQAKRPRQDR